jgi:hypothetical protein
MSGVKNSFLERASKRFVKNVMGLITQIRIFDFYSRFGDNVQCTNLTYDALGLVQDIYYTTEPITNVDLRVPERPAITGIVPASPSSSTSPTISGTSTGIISADGDVIKIIDSATKVVLGTGSSSSGVFSVVINLSSYTAPSAIPLQAVASNSQGSGQASLEVIYSLIP